ncbi:MAG: GNAT family N-acetyltransferase [Clostridiales bacterium]|nr:GNAT family N-acetyltransferase [Candidatus Cacconaster stercorequi]
MPYRKSIEEDCSTIHALICDMEQKPLPYEEFAEIYRSQLQNDSFYCLVRTENDAVIGFINLRFEQQLHHCETIAEIMEFVVSAHHRNGGIGRELLQEACALCRSRGCAQIEVACNQLRHDTHRFYEREGMHNFHYKFSKRLIDPDGDDNMLGR